MIIPMEKAAGWQPFSYRQRTGVFPRHSDCPKGEYSYLWTEDGKNVLRLLLVENTQQIPTAFVCSAYDRVLFLRFCPKNRT